MTVQTSIAADRPRCLLLIGDDAAQKRVVTATAARAGWWVFGAPNGDAAMAMLADEDNSDVGAVLLERWPGEAAGAALLHGIRAIRPGLPIFILADEGEAGLAIDAMRAGATDYLLRSRVADRLLSALHAAADRRKGGGELRFLSEKLSQPLEFEQIVGSSPEFRAAMAVAAKGARNRAAILIEGERGSGKELVARAIHHASPRKKKPFIAVDCAAIPHNHIESALFGHEQGAFAGAFTRHAGFFEAGDGGTIFLENIADLAPDMQERLARLMDSGEIERIGGTEPMSVDIRIVAGTTRKLANDAEAGLFNAELLTALSHVTVYLPPLRERRGDIPSLARHLLFHIGEQPGMRPVTISDDALGVLMRFGWPGNVRQLHNVLFRAAVLAKSEVLTAADFPHIQLESAYSRRAADIGSGMAAPVPAPSALTGAPGVTLFTPDGHLRPLEDIEADVIRLAIGHYRGRMTEVARRLGIGRSTLYRKLSELGIMDATQ
nr:sigma-54 dependent transcriptional regulator [Allosphingosinicella vermicomposti]